MFTFLAAVATSTAIELFTAGATLATATYVVVKAEK